MPLGARRRLVIGFKRLDDELAVCLVGIQRQAADVTAIPLADARLRLELAVPDDTTARGTVPGHECEW